MRESPFPQSRNLQRAEQSRSDGAEVDAGSDPLDPESIPLAFGKALPIAPDGAWTWFNDERAVFHQGALFVGYVQSNGDYGVTRYDPATNQSDHMVISTPDSRQRDDHNNPSITALPSGKLLLLYAKHSSSAEFYQRTSLVDQPTTDADWGPERTHQLPARNTYNNTYRLSAENDRIYNFHRSINFNPTLTLSNDLGESWEDTLHFIETGGGGTRPYPRYVSNHTDRIDLIYTDGHPRDVDNSIYHLYFRDGAVFKTDGTALAGFDQLPLDHDAGQRGTVVYAYSDAPWGPEDGPADWLPGGRAWTWDIHYDTEDRPVCVFQVQRDNVTGSGWNHDRSYYYYARWDGTKWEKHRIAHGGRGIYGREDDYGGGMAIDPENPNVVYISSNAAQPFNLGDIDAVPLAADERYELYRGTTSDGGRSFNWETVTVDSSADNLRPIVPENHGYDRAVLWFRGDYQSYTNFDCRVLAILENDLETGEFSIESDTANLQ